MTTSPESKWTKGPWSVEDPMGPEIISIVANGSAEAYDWKHVAQLAGKPEDSDDIPAHEAKANAHLISSAPDLYEALKGLSARFKMFLDWAGPCDHDVGLCNCTDRHAFEAATRALSKAKGR